MNSLLRLTFAKIKAGTRKNAFQALAILTSVFALVFLISFSLSLRKILLFSNSASQFIAFLKETLDALSFCIVLLSFCLTITIYTCARIRAEENEEFVSSLACIGATKGQRFFILIIELFAVYFTPCLIGSFLGVVFALGTSTVFCESLSLQYASNIDAWQFIISGGILTASVFIIVIILSFFPTTHSSRSLIGRLRHHNLRELREKHGYRNSYAFRHMPIEQRLAKKERSLQQNRLF